MNIDNGKSIENVNYIPEFYLGADKQKHQLILEG